MFFNQQTCEHISQVLIANNGYWIIIGLLGSWCITIFFGWFFVKHSIDYLQNKAKVKFESKKHKYPTLNNKWWFYCDSDSDLSNPNLWLGLCEVTLFYICLLVNKPEGIGAWLAFKVASKWESWTNIMNLSKLSELELLELRNDLATSELQKFLIGTIMNILVAFIGVVIFSMIRISILAEKPMQKSWIIWIIGIVMMLICMYIFNSCIINNLPKKKKKLAK